MSHATPDPGPATAVLPRDPDAVTPAAPVDPSPVPGVLLYPLGDRPESAQEAPEVPTPPAPTTGPQPFRVGVPARVNGPVRASTVVGWMIGAARVCGEWVSLESSATLRAVTVVVADLAAFTKWCGHLGVPASRRRRRTDPLGEYLQGVTTAHGWTIVVHLPNAPAQEPRP